MKLTSIREAVCDMEWSVVVWWNVTISREKIPIRKHRQCCSVKYNIRGFMALSRRGWRAQKEKRN
jgi:hypothetical protein